MRNRYIDFLLLVGVRSSVRKGHCWTHSATLIEFDRFEYGSDFR